ncbi:MAG: hypothetical protein JWP75_1615 [Frondihabitans sp.]|nr:hypothetical protein [Frondihabitans sp.]
MKVPLSMHVYNHLAYNSVGNQGALTTVENYLKENVR